VFAALASTSAAADGQEALHLRIDRIIAAEHVGPLAARCSDAEFLRRASLDLRGVIPSTEEVREFLADESPDKRERLIDRLLASPRYALHMTDVFDAMLMERRPDKHVKSPEWRQWLFESLAANKPYNRLAGEILAADGVDPQHRAPAKFYLDREAEPNLLTRDVGRMFFGMDLQCAQCHDHPLIDDYYQSDYYGLYAFVSRSYLFTDAKAKLTMLGEKAEGEVDFKSVFTGEEGKTPPRLPGEKPIAEPAFAKGEEYQVKPDKTVRGVPKFSRRAELAKLAAAGENDAFNRNIANRLWAHMLGRGFVDPPDLHHSGNPPSHPELLALLADEFAAMKYDIKALLRELALTEAYQRAFELPANLESQAKQAAGEVAKLESEQARLAAELATKSKLTGDAVSALAKGRDAAAGPSEEEQKQLTDEVSAAKRASADAQAEIKAVAAQLAEKQQTAAALAQAGDAAKKAAERLPDDKDLAAAAATIGQRASKFAAEIAAAEKLVAQRRAKAKQAADQLAAVEKQSAALASKRDAAQRQIAALEKSLADAEANRDRVRKELRALERRLDATTQLAQFGELAAQIEPLDANAKESETQLAQFETARAALGDEFARRFAVATLKPLTPEQLAWSMLAATGQLDAQRTAAAAEVAKKNPAKDDEPPETTGAREAEIEQAARAKLQSAVSAFVNLFGSAPGTPQDFVATVDQALFVSNGAQVRGWLNPSGENLTARCGKLEDPQAIAEELYLSIFGRPPDDVETAELTAYLNSQPEANPTAIQEIAWALLTSVEFRFNH
jgi:hypothetical protein